MEYDPLFVPTEDSADNVLIFPIGKFYRDGAERAFTRDDAQVMVDNFKGRVLGDSRLPPVNREHKRELGKLGDIVDLWLSEDGVRGKIDGDLAGFDYISPEVRWDWMHPFTGAKHKNVLMGAGATNYPFFLDKMAVNNDDALLWTGSDWEPFQDTTRDQLRERQAARAKRYGIGVKKGGNLTPPKDYPSTEGDYGDPVNYRYPADVSHAQPAVGYFNQAKNKSAGGYSDGEWAVIGKRLAKLVSKHLKASYKYSDGQLVRKDEKSMAGSDELNVQTEPQEHIKDGGNDMSDKPEKAPEVQATPTEDYGEKIAAYAEEIKTLKSQAEKFAEQLEAEKTERQRVEEAFAESEKQRRLMHFNDVVTGFALGAEMEKFSEDLYTIEKQDAELAGRMIERFRAASEAVRQGALFEQKSKAKAPESGDPFLAKVEQIRGEQFGEKPQAEGFTMALEKASDEYPDLAKAYTLRNR